MKEGKKQRHSNSVALHRFLTKLFTNYCCCNNWILLDDTIIRIFNNSLRVSLDFEMYVSVIIQGGLKFWNPWYFETWCTFYKKFYSHKGWVRNDANDKLVITRLPCEILANIFLVLHTLSWLLIKDQVTFKIYDVRNMGQTIRMHILRNIFRSKDN